MEDINVKFCCGLTLPPWLCQKVGLFGSSVIVNVTSMAATSKCYPSCYKTVIMVHVGCMYLCYSSMRCNLNFMCNQHFVKGFIVSEMFAL